LHGLADAMTINFPWASLLRGLLGHDEVVLAGVARLLSAGADASALVSVLPRDGVPPIPEAEVLAGAYARHGLQLAEVRPAAPAEVAASGSSWAKRLRAGRERPVTLLRFSRT
jgi:16S rRNA (adenine(1408)-N(1))-methyltransferase